MFRHMTILLLYPTTVPASSTKSDGNMHSQNAINVIDSPISLCHSILIVGDTFWKLEHMFDVLV
jgi:hypothetical protein